ncbi:MAG: hypothetical protein JXR96_10670 [Deltaproteobacteria bacterium]|nr:hypothetical protein [Deltaproteobacteria bacterium]
MRSQLMLFSLASAALLAAPSCAMDSPGALEQAGFSAGCSGADAVCLVGGIDAPIALGATLPVHIDLHVPGSTSPMTPLVPVDSSVVGAEGYALTGKEEGVCAVLLCSPAGQVLDFIHVWVERPAHLGFRRLHEDGSDLGRVERDFEMFVGDEAYLLIEPRAGLQPLLGYFPDATWSLEGQAVALVDEGVGHRRRLMARTAGVSLLRASAASLEACVEIEVLP